MPHTIIRAVSPFKKFRFRPMQDRCVSQTGAVGSHLVVLSRLWVIVRNLGLADLDVGSSLCRTPFPAAAVANAEQRQLARLLAEPQ